MVPRSHILGPVRSLPSNTSLSLAARPPPPGPAPSVALPTPELYVYLHFSSPLPLLLKPVYQLAPQLLDQLPSSVPSSNDLLPCQRLPPSSVSSSETCLPAGGQRLTPSHTSCACHTTRTRRPNMSPVSLSTPPAALRWMVSDDQPERTHRIQPARPPRPPDRQ